MRETDGNGRRRRQSAILIHNSFFSWPYPAVLSSRLNLALLLLDRGALNVWPAVDRSVGRSPSRAPSHSQAISVTDRIFFGRKLRLTISHVGICIYHFTTPTHFCSPRDCLFAQVHPVQRNLLLTARSRVNMQHYYSGPESTREQWQ